ncbi:P-loop NTPase family protein [Noviherbaspirillum pedocola]|uniref:Uncharacterized protein n=1 Tax=Noviherbaspirillum pedocola TaxID=2801341 RepID=A0A934W6E2_9BURK|nr:hypothetical protein [Noviherbaspirillum pedocola]MBK4735010.1 hypothetical protein [Noviherbaspirillum pedocola]
MGKSSLALQYAIAGSKRSEPVACFSFDEILNTLYDRARGLNIEAQHAEPRDRQGAISFHLSPCVVHQRQQFTGPRDYFTSCDRATLSTSLQTQGTFQGVLQID